MFEKLHKFLGKNLKNLVERTDEDHVFRLHKNRIYYVRESLLRRATNVSQYSALGNGSTSKAIPLTIPAGSLSLRNVYKNSFLKEQALAQVAGDKLVHLGSAVGKITHSGKFRLTIGCLGLLAANAKYKVLFLQYSCCGLASHPHIILHVSKSEIVDQIYSPSHMFLTCLYTAWSISKLF